MGTAGGAVPRQRSPAWSGIGQNDGARTGARTGTEPERGAGRPHHSSASCAITDPAPAITAMNNPFASGSTRAKKKRAVFSLAR